MKDLVDKQREYIEFLEGVVGSLTTMIKNPYNSPVDIIEEGKRLRKEIKQLEKNYE